VPTGVELGLVGVGVVHGLSVWSLGTVGQLSCVSSPKPSPSASFSTSALRRSSCPVELVVGCTSLAVSSSVGVKLAAAYELLTPYEWKIPPAAASRSTAIVSPAWTGIRAGNS
jgi:hypothetical protein